MRASRFAVIRHAATRPARRNFATPGGFSPEIQRLYQKVFLGNQPCWDHMGNLVGTTCPIWSKPKFRVLDLASGPGEPSVTLAKKFPDLEIVCTDGAEGMCEKAVQRSADLKNVTVKHVPAEELSQHFGENEFDVVVVSYGHMFFQDIVKTLQETRHVLKPGGKMIASYWRELQFSKVGQEAAKACGDDEPLAINPSALAEPGLFYANCKAAGFSDVDDSNTLSYPFIFDEEEYKSVGLIIYEGRLAEFEEAGDTEARGKATEAALQYAQRMGFFIGGKAVMAPNTAGIMICTK